MIFMAVSPDTLSLTMFTDFLRRGVYADQKIFYGNINCLYSVDVQERSIDEFMKGMSESDILLLTYKLKPHTKLESIPESVLNRCEYVVRFEQYATQPIVMREKDPQYLDVILKRWQMNIEKLDKL